VAGFTYSTIFAHKTHHHTYLLLDSLGDHVRLALKEPASKVGNLDMGGCVYSVEGCVYET
jgi:hypothetical protein